jgi:hypothetical protein
MPGPSWQERPTVQFAMQRSGIADLPLHAGSVPRWLADRVTVLGTNRRERANFTLLFPV